MIQSVKKIETVKASELPPTFDILVGSTVYPFEIESMDAHYVYMVETTSGDSVYIPRDEMVTILVPDTLENAAMDIELDLILQGIL